jgi:hypothetical protein
VARAMRDAKLRESGLQPGNQQWTEEGERMSQVPTLEPPEAPPEEIQRATTQSWSIRPSLSADGALDFVDGHTRESLAPSAFEPAERGLRPRSMPLDPGASLSDLYAVGNFTDAMHEAELRLKQNPNDEDAMRYADECRRTLTRMYTARLSPDTATLRIAVPLEEIRWLTLDHRAGFLLSLVDGQSTVEDLIDICGMARLDALRILVELHTRGVVALDAA